MYPGACESHKLFRGVHNQLPFRLYGAAYIIGQAAPCVGDILSFGIDDNLIPGIFPLQFCSHLGPCCHTADNDDFHAAASF